MYRRYGRSYTGQQLLGKFIIAIISIIIVLIWG